jgi:hypothetical protein
MHYLIESCIGLIFSGVLLYIRLKRYNIGGAQLVSYCAVDQTELIQRVVLSYNMVIGLNKS